MKTKTRFGFKMSSHSYFAKLGGHLKQYYNRVQPDLKKGQSSPPMIQYPFDREAKGIDFAIPLKHTFQFVHEPVGKDQPDDFIGRKAELDAFVERVIFSNGGSFLVTGYRGVGKSSFVNQAISHLRNTLPWASQFLGKTDLLDIYLNLARPVEPAELMHHIIRTLYDRLVETGIYGELPDDLQEDIRLAYMRTSLNMTRKQGESSEKNYGLGEVGISNSQSGAGIKGLFTIKKSVSHENEMSFLGYDDKAAEHDIIRISRRLTCENLIRQNFWDHINLRIHRQPLPRRRLKIIFVFDELDKLEEYVTKNKDERKPAIDEILGILKTLFTTSGLTFIFVAGSTLHEKWIEETGRGDSIYESVFSYDKYLSCMWEDTDRFCDHLVDQERFKAEPTIPNYCEHCGTRIVETDNEKPKSPDISISESPSNSALVKFIPPPCCPSCGAPILTTAFFCDNCGFQLIDPATTSQVEACASCGTHLEQPLDNDAHFCGNCGEKITQDWPYCIKCGFQLTDPNLSRQMLDIYQRFLKYTGRGIPRRILRSINKFVLWDAGQPFIGLTAREGRRIRFYADLQDIIDGEMEHILNFRFDDIYGNIKDNSRLAIYYIFDWIFSRGSQSFTFVDLVDVFTNLNIHGYYLKRGATEILQAISNILVQNDYIQVVPFLGKVQIADGDSFLPVEYRVTERRLLEIGILEQSEQYVGIPPEEQLNNQQIGQYLVLDFISEGGMGRIYQALDTTNKRIVALKVVELNHSNLKKLEILENESSILRYLSHPNIVKFFGYGDVRGKAYLAIEFIDGINLLDLLDLRHSLDLITAWSILQPIAEALHYIHQQGILHGDIKPSNILIDIGGKVHLTDFGLAKEYRSTNLGNRLHSIHAGTPPYSPPEVFTEKEPVPQSDVYALAATLYYALTGKMIYSGDSWSDIYQQQIQHGPDPLSSFCNIPPEVDTLILECLQVEPSDRPQLDKVIRVIKESVLRITHISIDLGEMVKEAKNSLEKQKKSRDEGTASIRSSSLIIRNPTERELGAETQLNSPRHNIRQENYNHPNDDAGVTSVEPNDIFEVVLETIPDIPGRTMDIYSLYDVTTIGRSPENDIELNDNDTSRYHAEIRKTKEGYSLEDLNSINGTLLNGTRILEKVILKDRDRITIGKQKFEFKVYLK